MASEIRRAIAIVLTVLATVALIPFILVFSLASLLMPDDEEERGYFKW